MAKNFATIAFSDAVKAMQEKAGSRASYARMEREKHVDGLTKSEMGFIAERGRTMRIHIPFRKASISPGVRSRKVRRSCTSSAG